MTDPDRADELRRDEEARELDAILQRINVGPSAPDALEPRLRRAVDLIWIVIGVLLLVGVATLVLHFVMR